jgi:NADH-quinone oxidoreductase subunit C
VTAHHPGGGGEALAGELAGAVPGAHGWCEFGQPTLDVPVTSWVAAVRTARDRFGFDYFDWLSALDEGDGRLRVVVHLWSRERRSHLLVRTAVAGDDALPSLTGVYAGAGWHERETAEMFGVRVTGFDDGSGQGIRPLLLRADAPPHPLRKAPPAGPPARPAGARSRPGRSAGAGS